MAVGIPLPELDVTKPQPAPFPDALQEFQRAAQLKTAAAQQQQLQAQTQGVQQQNEMQAMQLKDEQMRRQLAPQFVTKDENGKITGFDTEGLYSKMLENGADPLNINAMRMKQIEMQKALLGLNDEQKKNAEGHQAAITDTLQSIQKVYDQESKEMAKPGTPLTPATAPQAAQQPQQQPFTPGGIAGIPPWMQAPGQAAPEVGEAKPGTPESLARPPEGAAPTQSEGALQESAATAPRPIGPRTQKAYFQGLQNLQRQGVDVSRFQPVLHDAADLEDAEAQLGSFKEVQSLAEQQAKTAKESGEGTKAEAEAEASAWKPAGEGTLVNFKTGQMIHGIAPVEQQELQDYLKKNPDKGPEDFMKAKALLVPQFNINMNASGGGLGPSAPGSAGTGATTIDQVPPQIRGRVQAIVDYRQALPPAGRNNPVNSAISEWVQKLDPTHDETMFPARNKMMSSMTSGKEANQINAINTALGHVGVMSDAIEALDNTNIPALNAIANKLGVAVGNTPATTLQTIVHRVGPELAAAYIQGGGGEGERGTTADDFSINKGNEQLKANTAITAKLLRSKIASLENQYKQTMGRDDFQQRFITPDAQATLNKLSPQGQGADKTDFFSQFGGKSRQ